MLQQSRDKQQKIRANFNKNIQSLTNEIKDCLNKSLLISKDFGGPSVYFHEQAIKEAREGKFLGDEHLKMIYAVLAAWGMHRMGETKTKIVDFREFQERIVDGMGKKLRGYKKAKTTFEEEGFDKIAKLILDLEISTSTKRLVSASKALHHILPDLVPPIDRAYSIRFMKQGKFNKKTITISNEKWYAETFIEEMQLFYRNNKNTLDKFYEKRKGEDFITSIPKVLDNLIIAFVKKHTPQA